MRLPLAIAVLVASAAPAFAHKLHVDAHPEGDRVRVEAYHDDDTPAQEAKITVHNGDTLVAEGRTDDKGVWWFDNPGPGSYLIKAVSVGHAAKTRLDIEAAPTTPPVQIDRSEATRTPWRRIGLGIGIIAGMSIMALIFRRSASAKAK